MNKFSQLNTLWEPRSYTMHFRKKVLQGNTGRRTRAPRSQSNRRHH